MRMCFIFCSHLKYMKKHILFKKLHIFKAKIKNFLWGGLPDLHQWESAQPPHLPISSPRRRPRYMIFSAPALPVFKS